jgi:hypothetical protein
VELRFFSTVVDSERARLVWTIGSFVVGMAGLIALLVTRNRRRPVD